MKWIESFIYPLNHKHWQFSVLQPCCITGLGLLFWLTVAGGFLFIVGIKPSSCIMALVPLLGVGLFLITLAAGFLWRLSGRLASCNHHSWQDEDLSVGSLFKEGAQLLLLYGVFGAVCYLLYDLLGSAGFIVPLLLVCLYPVLLVPMACSAACEERNFSGLLAGFWESRHWLNKAYPQKWFSITSYGLGAFGLAGLAVSLVLCLSVVGVLLLPGLVVFLSIGLLHYTTRIMALEETFYLPETMVVLSSEIPFLSAYSPSVKTTPGFSEYYNQFFTVGPSPLAGEGPAAVGEFVE